MYRPVFWTLWAKLGWFERIPLKLVYYHMWSGPPVQVQYMRQGAQGWCSGMTLRDAMRWELGWGFRMGNTCTPIADSCQCIAKTTATATVKSLQSCLTLCDPIDGSPPGSPVPGILQARTLEWVAISFSNAWKWKVKGKLLSCVRPSATPWTAAFQASPSMGFSRQEYWSGVPLPSPMAKTATIL